MKKILIFPLLESLPSGHHQVANTIADYINHRTDHIECKKIDIMNSWSPFLEPLITKTYLWWIQHFPQSYAWVYRKLAYKSKKQRSYKHYDLLFQKKMEEIIAKEKPDLIICTHAFPSYLVSNLKRAGACHVPLLNIYTDFFINDVWGREMVDYHFVSDSNMKSNLVNNYQVDERKVFITGVPVNESFSSRAYIKQANKELNIILSGGSAGLGNIQELVTLSRQDERLKFHVLCGNNKQLFHELSKLNKSHIRPLPYLSSRNKMNDLYNLADAIITKPGGVTISEAIKKKVPIFIHSALPGQEEINLKHLKEKGLVFTINKASNLSEQLLRVLSDEPKMKEYHRSLNRYINTQDFNDSAELFQFINSILSPSKIREHLN